MSIARSPARCFEHAVRAYERAANDSPRPVCRTYRIAEHNINLHSASTQSADSIARDIAHLQVDESNTSSSSLCFWETESELNTAFNPWLPDDFAALKLGKADSGPSLVYEDDQYRFTSTRLDNLALHDKKNRNIFLWIQSNKYGFDRRHNALLREVLHWDLAQSGRHIIHSAAVGDERGIALLTGKSGSGKSTTALISLDSKLQFCADDNCYITLQPVPTAYSFIGSAKISTVAEKWILPKLAAAVENPMGIYDKGLVYMHEAASEKVILQGQIRAVIACEVMAHGTTRLMRASSAKVFHALAPPSMKEFPANSQASVSVMAQLVRLCPTWSLELGTDTHRIPSLISQVLDF